MTLPRAYALRVVPANRVTKVFDEHYRIVIPLEKTDVVIAVCADRSVAIRLLDLIETYGLIEAEEMLK